MLPLRLHASAAARAAAPYVQAYLDPCSVHLNCQGSARVIRCLSNKRAQLSPVCRATLFDEEVSGIAKWQAWVGWASCLGMLLFEDIALACCCLKISCAMNSSNALRSRRKTPRIGPGDGIFIALTLHTT